MFYLNYSTKLTFNFIAIILDMCSIIEIKDDFNLEKIRLSGQAFRIKKEIDDEASPTYTFYKNGETLKIQGVKTSLFKISCTKETFTKEWSDYFDLSRSYKKIRKENYGKSPFLDKALDFGSGLRILKQDPWETIVTFIISQRKSMPAITTSVERLCCKFGTFNKNNGFYEFPTPQQLAKATLQEIRECGVGYRAPYIQDAASCALSSKLDLQKCETLDDESLYNSLTQIKGVGKKVANCIMLFAFARTSCAPIDVWIERVINDEFDGIDPFPEFGNDAGIIQQYIFYWKTQHK